MPTTPLLGFLPDMPRTTPGAIVACDNMIPTASGFECGPAAIDVVGVGVLPSAAIGGAVTKSIAGTRRVYAGTLTKLYVYLSAAWDDVSRAGNYTGGADSRWSFAQFGDYTLATNGVDPIQQASGGDFTDISGAPAAKIVVTAANFVMAFNTVDGTYGSRPDAWWCSGIFDHTTWAPSLSTQANTGRLVSSGGFITAGLTFGEQVVAYKRDAMFVGTYVGGDAVWQWSQVQGEVGCVGQEAVCDAQGVHVFVGEDNIWAFDGVRPRPLAEGSVRQWFIDNSSPQYRYRTICLYEKRNNRVWVFFPSQNTQGGRPDSAMVYHLATGKWGLARREIDAALVFIEPSVTIDGLDALAATIDEIPAASFDSQFWIAGSQSLSVFNPSNQLQTLTGASTGGWMTVADIGDDVQVTHLDRATVLFNAAPTSSTAAGQVRMVSGGTAIDASSATLRDGSYKFRQSGRWHSLTFNFSGPAALTGYDYVLKPAGLR